MRRPSLHLNSIFLLALIASIILIISSLPQTCAQDSTMSYQLANLADGSYTYTLNVAIPQSLNEHYQSLSHVCLFDFNYPKFVTPYAVQPIADCLRQIYTDDEIFTNQVLTLVHQIPYEVTAPVYYPAETIAMNKGDCDLFSLIAASILKAGGLDIVLFRYVNEPHMNIGVHLTQVPQNTRTPVFSAQYENQSYYIAECTSTDWQNGWRVGECPKILQNASVVIISTARCEQTAPSQVLAIIENIDPVTLPIPISPPTFPSAPLPTTPDTPLPTPSSAPFSPPPDPIFIPTPADQSPSPAETLAPNPTPSPSLTPNSTSEPTQTTLPSPTPTPLLTPTPTTDTHNNPIPTCTPTTQPVTTAEPIDPLTNTPQLTQQAQTTNTVYILTTAAIITIILVAAALLKKLIIANKAPSA